MFYRVQAHLTYCFIGKFIYNNIKQSLKLVQTLPQQLEESKRALQITTDAQFYDWIREEKDYLDNITEVEEGDVLRVEYLMTLKKLRVAE